MAVKTAEKKKKEIAIVNGRKDLVELIATRAAIKALIEEAEADVRKMDEKIKAFMETIDEPSAIIGDYKVTVSKYVKESISPKTAREVLDNVTFEQIVSRALVTRLTIK
jgi:hypothetical protein